MFMKLINGENGAFDLPISYLISYISYIIFITTI